MEKGRCFSYRVRHEIRSRNSTSSNRSISLNAYQMFKQCRDLDLVSPLDGTLNSCSHIFRYLYCLNFESSLNRQKGITFESLLNVFSSDICI